MLKKKNIGVKLIASGMEVIDHTIYVQRILIKYDYFGQINEC